MKKWIVKKNIAPYVKIKYNQIQKEGLSMKFIHIADIHLGAVPDSGKPWGEDRAKEIWETMEHIIDVCNKEEVDLLLVAGDLFHRQPKVRELKELDYLFSKLETAQVVIMAGNHDYISIRSNYRDYPWSDNVHMFYIMDLQIMEFPEINTKVYGLSYLQRDITESIYDDLKPEDKKGFHILLAHGGDEKNIPINKKKLQASGFDYIALGHIHKPEIISERMAYSGSLEPLDKNETGERGYILGNVNKTAEASTKIDIKFIPSSQREYKSIELYIDVTTTNGALKDKALEEIRKNGDQNIYIFHIKGLRDPNIHFDYNGLMDLGNVLEMNDLSIPDYDFDRIYKENKDNMIGLFIKKIQESSQDDEIINKALYYGIGALLEAQKY